MDRSPSWIRGTPGTGGKAELMPAATHVWQHLPSLISGYVVSVLLSGICSGDG